jgi:hypothetical protein
VVLFLGVGTLLRADDTAATLDEVLKNTRAALGGAAIEKITSLSAEGEFRRTFGERETGGDIDLKVSGGDKLLWTESMSPTGDPTMRIVRTSGLNGTTTLESMTGGGGMMTRFAGPGGPGGGQGGAPSGAGGAPEDSAEARQARQLRAQQRQATRIMLALLLKNNGPLPLEFAYGGQADSDDGKADVVVVKGPDSFAAQLFISTETHLPMVLGYRDVQQRQMLRGGQGRPGGQPGQAGAAGQPPAPTPEEVERMREARERARAEPPTVIDVQWFLSDHKKVNGVMLPHTIRRAENGEVREEWTFKKFTINPVFKPDTFEKK